MEYWQLMEILNNKKVEVCKVDELEDKFHWTMAIYCNCRVFYIGIDHEKVELAYKEVNNG